jgi:hypothetical protein
MSLQKKQRLISMFIVTAPPGVDGSIMAESGTPGLRFTPDVTLPLCATKENWPSSFMSVIARARNAERYTTPEIYRVDLR